MSNNIASKHFFLPQAHYRRVTDLPFDSYLAAGYRHLFFDIDNTLLKHGEVKTDAATAGFLSALETKGFKCYLYSNAAADRLQKLCAQLQVPALTEARKPGKKALENFLQAHSISKESALVIGDQLFTDIWAANRAQVKNIWVDRLSRDEVWYIKPKRLLEALLRKIYKLDAEYDAILLEKYPDMR